MDLRQLIRTHKGTRTFADLAHDSRGQLTPQRWQQLATRHPKAFPTATTIAAIAAALAVSEEAVLLATGRSLGLHTSAPRRLVDLLPSSAAELPQYAITAILDVVRSMIALHGGML